MKKLLAFACIASTFQLGCNSSSGSVTDIQATDIADLYVQKNYPFSPRDRLRPVPHDQGKTWIVTYVAPDGSAGGTPTIEVDKRTGRVLHATHSQ